MKAKYLWVVLLSLLWGNVCYAQKATISDGIRFQDDDRFEIIGRFNTSLVVIKDKIVGGILYGFTPQMKLLWKKKIECQQDKFQYLGSVYTLDYFGIILQYKYKGEHIIEMQKMNAEGELIEKKIMKNYGKRNFAPDVTVLLAANHTTCAVIHKRVGEEAMEGFSFDASTMNVLENLNRLPLTDLSYNNNFQAAEVNNEGTIYFIFHKTFPRNEEMNNKFVLITSQKNQYKTYEFPTPSIKMFDVAFDFDEKNQNLVGAGFYDTRRKTKASGYFYLKVPKENPSNFLWKTNLFNDKLLTTIRGKKSTSGQSFTSAYIKDIILKSNGGVVLVAERYNESNQSSFNHPMAENHRVTSQYNYDDIILISLQENGNSTWSDVLYKRQHSRNDYGKESSFFIMKTPTLVRFIYNEGVASSHEVGEYTLTRTGKNQRHFVMNTKGYNVSLMFQYGMQLASNEIVVPSLERGKLKLVSLRY